MNNHPLPRTVPKTWERGMCDPVPTALHRIQEQSVGEGFLNTTRNSAGEFPGAVFFGRNFQGNEISVSTSPVLLFEESASRPVLILNTTRQTGMVKVVSAFDSVIAAAGTTQNSYIDCAGFETLHLSLTITDISGTWDIYAQSYDSLVDVWHDTQMVYNALAATTDSGYTHIGTNGVAERLAFRFDPTAAGSITCTLSCVLKGGTGSGLLGSLGVVYLGGRSVGAASGFPLLPNQSQIFQLEENAQMWAVSDTSVTVKTFLL